MISVLIRCSDDYRVLECINSVLKTSPTTLIIVSMTPNYSLRKAISKTGASCCIVPKYNAAITNNRGLKLVKKGKVIITDADTIFETGAIKQLSNALGKYDVAKPRLVFRSKNKFPYFSTIANLRTFFTFDKFAVSGSNQMAHAATQAVAETPGISYNPLFIYGGVGVGKTHLMHAVGHNMIVKNPAVKILACTAEDFTNDIVDGIRNKTTAEVRKKYRKLDALFIDDIQFIAGKDTAQEEFFHTFNAVTSAGGQVILTSDKPPTEISKLEDRLKTRFQAGLIVDIAPPDFELRSAIVQIKSEERGILLTNEMVSLIAGNVDSARGIQGFLVKLFTEVNFNKKNVSPELIQSLLGKTDKEDEIRIKIDPENLINKVAKYYSLGKRQLLGNSRQLPIVRPRQILMYLLRTQVKLPYQEVGRIVGRDHSTVMNSVDKITNLLSTNVDIQEDIMGIKKSL